MVTAVKRDGEVGFAYIKHLERYVIYNCLFVVRNKFLLFADPNRSYMLEAADEEKELIPDLFYFRACIGAGAPGSLDGKGRKGGALCP